ncbi:COG2426 family protein [Candidatus Caldatribacterium sp. SIUC1]|uniref:COG2426 family protein n=1 Tax=Candidatus Caldatribacterium sp. SIUC1 TaxID=3418365 RepID=UPI003F690BE8
MSLQGVFRVALLAFLPVSEVRGALPYGVFVEKLPLSFVAPLAFVVNLTPFFLVMGLLPQLVRLFQASAWFDRLFSWYTTHAQRRFATYRKYGKWGILLFVGVPLPFTGVWTGTLAAFLVGFGVWEIFPFVAGGAALATGLVTLLVFLGKGL